MENDFDTIIRKFFRVAYFVAIEQDCLSYRIVHKDTITSSIIDPSA